MLRIRGRELAIATAFLALWAATALAADMGSGFTYQGYLENTNQPVTDTCDFRFDLYDLDAAGTLKGTQPALDVDVDQGVFTVALDFGAGKFDGTAR